MTREAIDLSDQIALDLPTTCVHPFKTQVHSEGFCLFPFFF